MDTGKTPEERWRRQLKLEVTYLHKLEIGSTASAREIVKVRDRIARMWSRGLPEWQAKGMPTRWP